MNVTVMPLVGDVLTFVVDGKDTVGDLKARVAEKTSTAVDSFALYRCKPTTYLAVVKTLGDAGIVDGDQLYARPRDGLKQRAVSRIRRVGVRPKRGGVARSVKYDIRVATEDVIDEVAADGKKTRVKVDACLTILKGGEVPRTPGQTDKERMKQIRSSKQSMNNELLDIREREGAPPDPDLCLQR